MSILLNTYLHYFKYKLLLFQKCLTTFKFSQNFFFGHIVSLGKILILEPNCDPNNNTYLRRTLKGVFSEPRNSKYLIFCLTEGVVWK